MLQGIDTYLLIWLNGHLLPHSLPVLEFVSDYTTAVNIGFLALLLVISFFKGRDFLQSKFLALTVVLITSGILTFALKSAIMRERPFYDHPEVIKRHDGGGSSFPSGHTMEAFAMAIGVLAAFRERRAIAVPFIIWAVLVGYSRIALGVHYPTDVLAGMAIGSLIGALIPLVFRKKRR